MPLAIDSLIEPKGDLSATLFLPTEEEASDGTSPIASPRAKLEALLAGWVERAETVYPSSERAQRHAVYGYAYRLKAQKLLEQALQQEVEGEGRVQYVLSQSDRFAELAAAEEARAEAAAAGVVTVARRPSTGVARARSVWG